MTSDGNGMHPREAATYLTVDHLELRAAAKIRDAERLRPGGARQHALRNAAQLLCFAAMKRDLQTDLSKKSAAE